MLLKLEDSSNLPASTLSKRSYVNSTGLSYEAVTGLMTMQIFGSGDNDVGSSIFLGQWALGLKGERLCGRRSSRYARSSTTMAGSYAPLVCSFRPSTSHAWISWISMGYSVQTADEFFNVLFFDVLAT
jgi:hypothetical protein